MRILYYGMFGLCLLTMLACVSKPNNSAAQLLKNPSIHILLNHEEAIPRKGTFDFDTKLFKINYSEEVDLASIDDRILGALEAELKRKGYQRSKSNPDLLVSYAVALDAPLSGADFNAAYAGVTPFVIPESPVHQDTNYHQGALIVDFVDQASGKLLWRGAVMAKLSMEVTAKEKDLRVRYGSEILLQHFPKPIQEQNL